MSWPGYGVGPMGVALPAAAPVSGQQGDRGVSSGVDPVLAFYASRVKQLACLSFWLHACCGLVCVVILLAIGAAIPAGVHYEQILEMCDDGKLDPYVCKVLNRAFANICKRQHLEGAECTSCLNGQTGDEIKDNIFGLAVLVGAAICLCNPVRLCGYFGAQQNSRRMVSCFMVFNFLGVALFFMRPFLAYGDEGSSANLPGHLYYFWLPAASCYYALCLWKQQGQPHALAAPLLQSHVPQQVFYQQPPQQQVPHSLYQQQAMYNPPMLPSYPAAPQTYFNSLD
eukprot:CAMPEP_0183530924 /NCGR_PEP_ID=MMETSP0371-20130417/24458_1 /TAXON_ID=268820 /ORGANISM="Peridinium aciculiferum, Strain PAER-2" /LENGTH=282 /DNA_ID=CAMNT_0025730883 /DNA_START=22 /DNA_END=870 /DNA_ORIENTATION=-